MANTKSSLLNQTVQAATFALREYFRPIVFAMRILKLGPVPAATEVSGADRVSLETAKGTLPASSRSGGQAERLHKDTPL
jgi:hypothetical protein